MRLSDNVSSPSRHCWRGLSGCREFLSVFVFIPECSLGLVLELPDPLAGDVKLLAQFSEGGRDRKSTRLNSSHANISYAVFCLKKKIHFVMFLRLATHLSSSVPASQF